MTGFYSSEIPFPSARHGRIGALGLNLLTGAGPEAAANRRRFGDFRRLR